MRFIYIPLVALAKLFGYNPQDECKQDIPDDIQLAKTQLAEAKIEMLQAEGIAEMKEAAVMAYKTRIARLKKYIADAERSKPEFPPETKGPHSDSYLS